MNIGRLSSDWQVNGTSIYEPSADLKIDHENVAGESSGRTEDGKMHIDWVRRDVTKVFLAYSALSESELLNLKTLMQGKEFSFKFKDCGQSRTIQAYCGKMSYTHHFTDKLGTEVYTNITADVIEI